MAKIIFSVEGITKEHVLTSTSTFIGREDTSHIKIDKLYVSGTHLLIKKIHEKFFIYHAQPELGVLATGNGFWHEDYHYAGNEKFSQQLVHGDTFYIGSSYGDLVTITYSDERLESPMGPSTPLDRANITIGNREEDTIRLQHPRVNGHVASLEKKLEGYYLVNKGNDKNKKRVNINSRAVRDSQLLTPGDQISIGPYKFLYKNEELVPYPEDEGIHLEARKLKQVIKKRKFLFFWKEGSILLNDLSLTISPGEFIALLGGSGSGKSTLIKALSGYQRPTAGTVLYNGRDFYDDQACFSYRTQLGYVPQEDILHFDLTVQAALFYAAQLRLSSDFTEKQIEQRMTNVLVDVGMVEHKDKLVKELSGGQRKRISIAIELLPKPKIFFLDEPISGLDPGLDLEIMLLLRDLAKRGQTIILSTHSISHINYCQYICFLISGGNQGGRLAYFGPPPLLLLMNFAQHGLQNSGVFNTPVLPDYQGDAQRFLFIMAFASVMFGCVNAAREIVKEIHIYQREHMVGLGIVPYLFSKIVVLGRLCLIQSFILVLFILLTFIFSGNNLFHAGIFLPVIFEVFITLALTSLAGLMLGLLISALVPTNELAMSVIPLILIPQVIFSGIIFPLQNVFLQSIGSLFAVRWAMAALGSSFSLDNSLFASNGGDKLFGTCDTCGTYRHDLGHLLLIWGVLIAMIILLAIVTGYFLKRKEAKALRR